MEYFPAHFAHGPSLLLLQRRVLDLPRAVVATFFLVGVLAVEVLLVHVNPQVALQGGVVVEALGADGAGVGLLPRVDADVSHHVVVAVEEFPTFAAVERFLSGVDPHVRRQRLGSTEALPTDAADFGFHVRLHVNSEALLRLRALPTDAADVLGVDVHVIH